MPTQRNLRDANFIKTKALPAANATNLTDVIDLQAVLGNPDPEAFLIEVAVPALPANSDATKTILITLQDSEDDSSYADVEPLIQCKIPGVATTGSAAKTFTFRTPPGLRRYVKFLQTVPTGAGDNTAKSVTYSLLF